MSKFTQGTNTNKQSTGFYDTSKVFIGRNRFDNFQALFNIDQYADNVLEGTVFGRVASSGKVVPLSPLASDGSQIPIGILLGDINVLSGTNYDGQVTLCVAGDVAEEKVLFADSVTTLDTIVNNRRLRDRIGSDTVGIKLQPGTELTEKDND